MPLSGDILTFAEKADHGRMVLRPGVHHVTEQEFEDFFVTSFKGSETRAKLAEEYKKIRLEIKALVPSLHWIDGEFVEDVENPATLMAVVWAEDAHLDDLSQESRARLDEFRNGALRPGCNCQVNIKFFAKCAADSPAKHRIYQLTHRQILNDMQKTGIRSTKGILALPQPNDLPAPVVPSGAELFVPRTEDENGQ